MPDGGNVTAHVLSRFLGITPRRIQQLAKEGEIPKAGRGRYPLILCVQAYIRYWQERAEGRVEENTFDSARRRELEAKAELREIELAEKREDLVPRCDVAALVRRPLDLVDRELKAARSRKAKSWAKRLKVSEAEAMALIEDLVEEIRTNLRELADDTEAAA